MHPKTRIKILEAAVNPPVPYRCLIQTVSEHGAAKPTDEEVARQVADWKAEGVDDPMIVRVTTNRSLSKRVDRPEPIHEGH